MLIAGMMAHYGFLLNMHDNVLYKTKNGRKRGGIKTNLYVCDNKDNDMIQDSIAGGRTPVRTHYFESKYRNKKV